MGFAIKNFYGMINDKTIYDFSRGLDYSVDNIEDRLKLVNDRFCDESGKMQDFWQEVYSQKFDGKTGTNKSNIKLVINTTDGLYSDTNVAKELEKIADYLLFCAEEKEEKVKYKFYKTDGLVKDMWNADKNFYVDCLDFTNDGGDNQKDMFLTMYVSGERNFKKEIKQKIYKHDLKDEELKYLVEYQEFIDSLKELRNNTDDKGKKLKYNKMISTLIDDQIMIKDKVKGTIYFKQVLGDSTEIDWDRIDFSEPAHVMEMLRVSKGNNFNKDLACIVHDLNNIIKKCRFTEVEHRVLSLWSKTDLQQEIIGQMLNMTQQNISKTLNRIVDKIITQYEKDYKDWYYTFIAKGTYKSCKRCGTVKLVDEFGFDVRNKDGLKGYCRDCDKR